MILFSKNHQDSLILKLLITLHILLPYVDSLKLKYSKYHSYIEHHKMVFKLKSFIKTVMEYRTH